MSYTLTNDDFLERLKEKITVLQLLCKSYDTENKYSLAKEMAVAIRVIAYDNGSNSVSLLTHLGIKNSIQLLSTMAQPKPNRLMLFGDGLFSLKMECGTNGSHLVYSPKLGNSNQSYLNFASWWEEKVLHDMADDYTSKTWYTRKDLIIAYCNKEGGAHVDKTLPDAVVRQSNDKITGFTFYVTNNSGYNTESKADNTPKDATIRQIAYELLYSLFKIYPNLFSEEYF